ncbi:hypothetical protein ACHQM5_003054 [Ranunculus cassubicifolius]
MSLFDPNSATLDYLEWDEAWYSVRLILHKNTLTAKYCDHSDMFDLHFKASDFKDTKDLEDFIKKFRPLSVQLQDQHCHKVTKGMIVCASYVFAPDDVRFYDAVVTDVKLGDHKFLSEECTCTFVLYWLRGPNAGTTSDASVAHIMLLQSGNAESDPTLSSFLEICRKKIKARRENENAIVEYRQKKVKTSTHSLSRARKPGRPTMHHGKRTIILGLAVEVPKSTKKDIVLSHVKDLPETSTLHFIWIDNLEKELSPLTVVKFVKKYVSISCVAQVFPSSSSQSSYTRGIVLADSPEDLLKLSNFVLDPAHMILSYNGRPWVAMEQKSGFDNSGPMVLSTRLRRRVKPRRKLMLSASMPQSRCPVRDNLRVVSRGTTEYDRGMQLKNLFLQYADLQRDLQQRFASEEGKILHQLMFSPRV